MLFGIQTAYFNNLMLIYTSFNLILKKYITIFAKYIQDC